MKVRIMGTSEEVKELAELLPAIMKVNSLSEEYPNRGYSNEVRVYADGVVYDNIPYVDLIKKYAPLKKEDMGAVTMIGCTKEGIHEGTVAKSKVDFLKLVIYILSGEFLENYKKQIEEIIDAEKQNIDEEYLEKLKFFENLNSSSKVS